MFSFGGGDIDYVGSYSYLITDLVLNTIGLIVVIAAFPKQSKLQFTGHLESRLDQNLLIFAMTGNYFLLSFRMISSFIGILEGTSPLKYCVLHFAGSIVSFVESTLNVLFVIDGLRRKSETREHIKKKPGRSLITFLLICNLSMWVVNSFKLKDINDSHLMQDFFGEIGWVIILYLCLPVAVFFRFHMSVCLSDIWSDAYSKPSQFPPRPPTQLSTISEASTMPQSPKGDAAQARRAVFFLSHNAEKMNQATEI